MVSIDQLGNGGPRSGESPAAEWLVALVDSDSTATTSTEASVSSGKSLEVSAGVLTVAVAEMVSKTFSADERKDVVVPDRDDSFVLARCWSRGAVSSADSLCISAAGFSVTTAADTASGKLVPDEGDAAEPDDSELVFGAVFPVNSSGIPASESSAKVAPDVASGGE